MSRFGTEILAQPRNLEALMELSGMWIDGLQERRPIREITLDMDSSASETYLPRRSLATIVASPAIRGRASLRRWTDCAQAVGHRMM